MEVFVNEADNQVRAAHKILGYNPIQKSFPAPKHMIRANDPRLHKITIAEHGFLLPKGSPVPEGIPLAGPSSSHQVAEAEDDLGPSEDEFSVFDPVSLFEDPSGDLGNPNLIEADLLSARTSPQSEMGFKRKPSTSLLDLIEGQPGKPQSKLPPPPPQPQPTQTRSSST